MSLRVIAGASAAGQQALAELQQRGDFAISHEVLAAAERIVGEVRNGGDAALLDHVRRLDGWPEVSAAAALRLDEPEAAVGSAAEEVSAELREAIEYSISAVTAFYAPQRPRDVRQATAGHRLEERFVPYRRVGLYVPGGRFPYPSTVIMSAVPARLAGVAEIVVVTPPQAYRRSAALRFTCRRLGVDEVWGMGGAHAIAALAYGTESVRAVDFIAGPGNVWVTAGKRLVARDVGIDKEAGPSEVVIVASEDAPAPWIAADLLAQAEHDPRAVCVLLTPSQRLADEVAAQVASQLSRLATRETAAAALGERSCALVTEDLETAIELAEGIAPEHLQLMGSAAEALESRVRRAGAVFVGAHTPTVLGDYVAGPSHVLPTGGAARFASGLGVEDFARRQHHAAFTPAASARAAAYAAALAREEGLVAHAHSAELRSAAAGSLSAGAACEGEGECQPLPPIDDPSPARFVRPELRALSEYSLHQVPFVHKLDQNEVPWDLPQRLKREALRRLEQRNWAHYPDFHGERLRALLAARHEWPHDGVLVGNGSNELLGIALDALVRPGTEVLSALPTFGLYEMFVRRSGGTPRFLPPRWDLALPFAELCEELERDPDRPLVLCTPNNPTGAALEPAQVDELARRIEAPLLLDNAYGEFCCHDYRPLLQHHRHLLLFGTFSKAWSLAGLRLGYLLADPDLVRELIKIKLPYNVNHAAAVIGELVLEEPRWSERCVRLLVALRERFAQLLRSYGLEVFASQGNFLLVRHPEMERLRLGLAERGILIRKMSHYPGLENCARIAVGDKRALRALEEALAELLRSAVPSASPFQAQATGQGERS